MLRGPQLFGLQIQDPKPHPRVVSLNFCCSSTLSRSEVGLFFFSLTLPSSPPITQNKIWPCLSCLLICSQLPITRAWTARGQRPTTGPATQRFSEHGPTGSHGGLGSVNSFHYQPKPDVCGEICQEKITHLCSPTEKKGRLRYYLFLITCASATLPAGP